MPGKKPLRDQGFPSPLDKLRQTIATGQVGGRGGRPRVYSFKWWTADDDSADNIDLLDAGGAGFCEQVRGHYEQFTRSLVTLTHVYALQIERIAEA